MILVARGPFAESSEKGSWHLEWVFLFPSTHPLISRSVSAGTHDISAKPSLLRPLALSEFLHIEFAKLEAYFIHPYGIVTRGHEGQNVSREWPSRRSPVGHLEGPSRTSLWLCAIFLLSRVHKNWCHLDASPDIVLQLSLKFGQVMFYKPTIELALLN